MIQEESDFEEGGDDFEDSAEGLADMLQCTGAVLSPHVDDAFRIVDRADFLPKMHREYAYDDSPLRVYEDDCVVHLSAPSIYASALEALKLARGLSFLNVGSGSGYLSTLVAAIVSPNAVHHCVERCPVLAERSRRIFADNPLTRNVQVHTASIFDVDPDGDAAVRFDRVYCGAGALAADTRFFSRFLKPGGILVGPFQIAEEEQEDDEDDRPPGSLPRATHALRMLMRLDQHQCLIRATLSKKPLELEVDEILPVQFTPLKRREPTTKDEKQAEQVTVLRGPIWGIDSPELFPPCFQFAVHLFKRKGMAETTTYCCFANLLPWHVWECNILNFLAHDDINNDI